MDLGLDIRALGGLQVRLDGQPLQGSTDRRREILLVYLADCATPQPRKDLARFLWPTADEQAAYANLRSLLKRMRQEGLAPFLRADRTTLGLHPDAHVFYDAGIFRTVLSRLDGTSRSSLTTAVDLYAGAFLRGVQLREAGEFEEWMLARERELEQLAVRGLQRLIYLAWDADDTSAAVQHAQRLVELAPFDDMQHLLLMRALVQDARRADALHHYAAYLQVLQTEVGLSAASPELAAFAETLRTVPPQARAHPADTTTPSVPQRGGDVDLPRSAYPLSGREAELTALHHLIVDDGARLVTIVGLGGAGKTHLMLELGTRLHAHFRDGVIFVDLASEVPDASAQSTEDADIVLRSLARALNVSSTGARTLEAQLTVELVGRHQCLLLDNFEHLAGAAPLLSRFIAAAPRITIVITSRVRLNLTAEHGFVLHGLDTPATDALEVVAESSAVQLYMNALHRFQPHFTLGPDNAATIAAICRKLGGLPLALILTASWAQLLTPAEVLAELDQNQDLLATRAKDIPDRQHSMHRILESTWLLLQNRRRLTMMKLSLFADDFDRSAADAVTGATLPDLYALVECALLTVTTPGYYAIHPLVRQFAKGKLAEVDVTGSRYTRAAADHAAHYWAWFIAQMKADPRARELTVAYDNLRLALKWYLAHEPETLMSDFKSLADYWSARAQVDEARYWLQQLLSRAPAMSHIRADLMLQLARFSSHQQDFVSAEELAQGALTIYSVQDIPSGAGACMELMGWIMFDQPKRRAEAFAWFEASRNIRPQADDRQNWARLTWAMACCFVYIDMDKAVPYVEEAILAVDEMDETAECLLRVTQLELALARGDRVTAEDAYYKVKDSVYRHHSNYSETWIVYALAAFGCDMGYLEEAEHYNALALGNFEAMGAPRGRLKCIVTRADIQRSRHETDTARQLYEECLHDPYTAWEDEVVVSCLHGLAKLNLTTGATATAVEQLAGAQAIVTRTPLVIKHVDRQRLQTTINRACTELDDAELDVHWELGQAYWKTRTAESSDTGAGCGAP